MDPPKQLTGKMGSRCAMKFEGAPQVGTVLSSRILAREEAVACLPGRASVQWENMQTTTKTYLYL